MEGPKLVQVFVQEANGKDDCHLCHSNGVFVFCFFNSHVAIQEEFFDFLRSIVSRASPFYS
jgi:hypothetical protein